jgi:hypothetical protein
MYSALLHAHSGLRWIVLFLIVAAIFNAVISRKKGTFEKKDKMLNLFAMISMHIQLLIGLVVYFMSEKVQFTAGWMKVGAYRFFGMEHFIGMVLAIILITIGRKKSENAALVADKHKKIIVFYTIALLLVLAFIPWPFRTELGGRWM